jgi:hypothetical protein
MVLARSLVHLLEAHRGEQYVFGALAPKENSNYKGPWDCAEFEAWGIYQISGQYVGCRGPKHDAYTGFFAQDLPRIGSAISEDFAAEMIGAICLKEPQLGRIGHIAVSSGAGRTIEARGGGHGVGNFSIRGRGFKTFYLIRNWAYEFSSDFGPMPSVKNYA